MTRFRSEKLKFAPLLAKTQLI